MQILVQSQAIEFNPNESKYSEEHVRSSTLQQYLLPSSRDQDHSVLIFEQNFDVVFVEVYFTETSPFSIFYGIQSLHTVKTTNIAYSSSKRNSEVPNNE